MVELATPAETLRPRGSLKRDSMWSALDTFASAGLAFIFRLVLARVISPGEFGVFALAMVTFAIVQVINEFGMAATIIQRPADKFNKELVDTAYFATTIVSVSLFIINLAIIAPISAWVYDSERVGLVTAAIGFSFLFTPNVSISRALLTRERNYRAITYSRIISTLLSLLLAGITLVIFRNVWSLVVQIVSSQVLLAVAMRRFETWKPKFRFSRNDFKEMIGYSGLIFILDAFGSIAKNFDVIVLGRLLSQSQVGLYSLAFYITDIVRMNLASILNRVMFTHYSSIQHDFSAVRFHMIRTLSWNQILIFPIMIVTILCGPVILPIILGPKWNGMGPTIQLLSVASMLGTISGTGATVLKALGKPAIELAVVVFADFVVLVPTLVFGVYFYGIAGAAGALVFRSALTVVLRQIILERLVGSTIIRTTKATLGSLLVQLPIVACWVLLLPNIHLSSPFNVIIAASCGLAAYAGSLAIVRRFGRPLWPAF